MRKRIISFGLAAVLAAASVVSVSAADSSAESAAVSGAESVAESVYSYPDWQVDAEIPQAPSDGDTTITVGASPSPHAEILEQVKDSLAAKGWTLDVKEYSDYVQPNAALASGDLDANYFQHQPYLDEYNKAAGDGREGKVIYQFPLHADIRKNIAAAYLPPAYVVKSAPLSSASLSCSFWVEFGQ